MRPFFVPPPQKSEFNKMSQRAGKGIDTPLDEAGHTLLHVSALKGDVAAVERLLQLGANPRQLDINGHTPLFSAVATQNIALVKLLVDKGASFNVEDDNGQTPLQHAIDRKADVAFLGQLRDLGMNLDFHGKSGRGALHAAAAAGNLEVLDYLITNKVSIDATDDAGRTALHAALENGAHDAAKHLLAAGANPLLRTNEIKSPLYIAAARGDTVAVDALLEIADVRRTLNDFQTYTEGFTPLMAAVAGNHQDVAEKLIASGAHVNQLDHQNRHSLFIAVEAGFPQLVQMLIEKGADVEKAPRLTNASLSLVHKINPSHYKEILHLLYAAGADLNAVDSTGCTALFKASDTRDPVKAKALLELGANPEIANTYGRRPLDAVVSSVASSYYAPSAEAYETTRALLLAGANPNLPPSSTVSSSPLHNAVRTGRGELVKLLLDHGAIVDEPERSSGTTPWLVAVSIGNIEACELLRLKGADTTRKDNQQRSVLHYAAQSGAKKLLEAGLNDPAFAGQVNTPDTSGSTPLHFAARFQKADCIRILLAAGANSLAYDGMGQTPLHIVATSYSDAMFMIFDQELGKKANWNIQSRTEKETPLHIAAKRGSQSIVQRLLKIDANVTLQDRNGFTPLMTAIKSEQNTTTAQLIDYMRLKNISLDAARDNNGWTALHLAAQSWSATGAALLINGGADVNSLTPDGNTPLHLAIRSARLENIRLMAARGGDLTLANKTGATALDLAKETNRPDIVDFVQRAIAEQQQKKLAQKPFGFRPPPHSRSHSRSFGP